ncbi:type II secretion system F family protein [Streptomyces sp. DSM 44918]|uniref:Type II secretion system F family protein n=1 Tax=Streptomyces millisiae TaxID=3075542 RepID=A0ABU2LW09_9ACTN|nr:type II secretion system F family protein [Streptomyces sp. DSM 44918]
MRAHTRREHAGRWLLAALVSGAAGAALTGWPIAALLAGTGVWSLPHILDSSSESERRIEQVDAIAGWTEMLRDTLSAGAGLEQTITATADTAPAAIRQHVRALADRLDDGQDLDVALGQLAADLGDVTADLVIIALTLSSQRPARQLGPLLGALAGTARRRVEMRRRIETARATIRTTVRIVTGTTAVFISALVLFNRPFLTPYDDTAGQIALLAVAGIFAAAFVWLMRLARVEEPERFLTTRPERPEAGRW